MSFLNNLIKNNKTTELLESIYKKTFGKAISVLNKHNI